MQINKKTCVMCILDGWGERTDGKIGSALIKTTPFLDHLKIKYPSALLQASEESAGLPTGQMGNSEVGHTIIGSGRIIQQDLMRISQNLKKTSSFATQTIISSFRKAFNTQKDYHILCLLSDGGIHSHINHLETILKIAHREKVKIYLHLFLDGRDTPPHSALKYLENIKLYLTKKITIATIMGRFYSMDRDKRWDRTYKAYQAIIEAKGENFTNPIDYVKKCYQQKITDEFIPPAYQKNYKGVQKNSHFFHCRNIFYDRNFRS